MKRTREVRLLVPDEECWSVFVNDFLVGEYSGGDICGYEELHSMVIQSRCLKALPKIIESAITRLRRIHNAEDHVNTTKEKKQAAFTRGMVDGLLDLSTPHPSGGVPPITKEHTPSYLTGHEYGRSIADCAMAADCYEYDPTNGESQELH